MGPGGGGAGGASPAAWADGALRPPSPALTLANSACASTSATSTSALNLAIASSAVSTASPRASASLPLSSKKPVGRCPAAWAGSPAAGGGAPEGPAGAAPEGPAGAPPPLLSES